MFLIKFVIAVFYFFSAPLVISKKKQKKIFFFFLYRQWKTLVTFFASKTNLCLKKSMHKKKEIKTLMYCFVILLVNGFNFFFFNQVDDFDVQNLEFSIVNVEKLAR